MKVTWDNRALRYRAGSGRFIKREAVLREMEKSIAETARRMKRLSEGLQARRTNLPEWQLGMRDLVRAQHVLSAGVAQGGKAQLSPAALGRIGALTKKQYAYLNNFSRQIANGQQKLGGRFIQRAMQYASAARQTFSETERRLMRDAGYTEERNLLHSSEHCGECSAEASKGWVPVGSLSPVGSRSCLVNCRCTLEMRRAA